MRVGGLLITYYLLLKLGTGRLSLQVVWRLEKSIESMKPSDWRKQNVLQKTPLLAGSVELQLLLSPPGK